MSGCLRPIRAAGYVGICTLVFTCGCAHDRQYSGEDIITRLEASGVRAPDASGKPTQAEAEATLPAHGSITLADLIRVAAARHPSLAAARASAGIAAGEAWQAAMYPNPRADMEVEDVSLDDGASDSKITVGVTLPIILGGRRDAAIDAAESKWRVEEARVLLVTRALHAEVAALHARLVALTEEESLLAGLRAGTQRLMGDAQARFEARAAPETDVIRPRVEMYRLDARAARIAREREVILSQIEVLVGEFDAARIELLATSEHPEFDKDALTRAVIESHPALIVADQEIEAARARLHLIDAEITPDLDMRLAAGYRGEREDAIVELGAGMEIPLWDRRRGDLLAARFAVLHAHEKRREVEQDLLAQLAGALGEYEATRPELSAYHDQILPEAQRALSLTSEGYRGGRGTFTDVLDAQRTLTEAMIEAATLSGRAAEARARLLAIVGPEAVQSKPGASSPSGSSSEEVSGTMLRPIGAEESQ